MKKFALTSLIFSVLFSGILACSPKQENKDVATIVEQDMTLAVADSVAVPVTNEISDNKEKTEEKIQEPQWEKKIIKTGNLGVRVEAIAEYEQWVVEKTKAAGGYISSDEQHSYDGAAQKTMVIKVPVQQFDALIKNLCKPGLQVMERTISSEDVSQEFYDLNTRLASKKKILQRYLDILSKAHKVSEILEVQAEINRIQEEMESVEGRSKYLAHQSALSTITLRIESGNKIETLEPGFGQRVKESFTNGWQYFKGIVLGFVALWPLWLLATVGVLVWRRWKKK